MKRKTNSIQFFILFSFLFFKIEFYISQSIIKEYGKTYRVFHNFQDANKINPDSVEGICLISNGFDDFPKEIFKYKNLKYLQIGSYYWGNVLDSLSENERREYDSLVKITCDRCEIKRYYKQNVIKSIPKKIKSLKKLEVCIFVGAKIQNWRRFKKIYRYLPNPRISPPKNGY